MITIEPWFRTAIGIAAFGCAVTCGGAQAEVLRQQRTTALKIPSQEADPDRIDYANAIPRELPTVAFRADVQVQPAAHPATQSSTGTPAVVPGHPGTGKQHPVTLPKPEAPTGGMALQDFGTTDHPFSTAKNDSPKTTNRSFPSRAAGRLFFNIGASTYVCSAALIRRGIVVTAAHCVADFGKQQFYSNWQFVPGYRNGAAPYGIWTAAAATVPSSYYDGTNPCYAGAPGIVCQDDVAVLTLLPQNDAYAGTSTGWYGYGWNGYGFTSAQLTQITQLGYPVCLDNGLFQQRNDSYGYVNETLQNNTVIGSLMCGGSSGGPWLVNFGLAPRLTGTTAGAAAKRNVVIGVTSWSYLGTGPKEMGASPFTSDNIQALVDSACAATPAACS